MSDVKLPNGYEMTERTRLKVRYEVSEGRDLVIDSGVKWLGPFMNLEDCQIAYIDERENLNLGASQFSSGEVFDEYGQFVARISYNGKLWDTNPWTPGVEPIAEAPERNSGLKP